MGGVGYYISVKVVFIQRTVMYGKPLTVKGGNSMKRLMVTCVLLALCSLSLTGCPVVDGKVVVVDDIEGLTIQSIGDQIVSFFNDLGDKAAIQVDDIIASAQDGGFLRKVIGVNQSGGVITTVTEAISLAEAVKEGVLSGVVT